MMHVRGWSSCGQARAGSASRMAWLMGTGRFANYERYVVEVDRKDDRRWQFETTLDFVLDGIAARLAI
ncbi:hypothetical protein [Nocardia tengchongensis]|uniref:hypothetical protein n=1 Tax=Nocardia tengchongensis TaxID=2055889 RepID=UPI003620E2D2